MQPRSAASQAKSQRKRAAYHNAMNSKTAGLLGISSTNPSSSLGGAVDSSQLETPTTLSDDDEEENSYDKNDDMEEDNLFVDGHIEIPIPKDGHIQISDDDGVSVRKNKRQKGMKVGPKVVVSSSSKAGSKVWDHFEKVPQPTQTEAGVVMVIMAQCNYCKKFFSYKKEQGGTTSHLLRHYRNSCPDYKIAMAAAATHVLTTKLEYAMSCAEFCGVGPST